MARRRDRITSGDGRRVTAEDVREDSGDEPDEPEGEPEDSGTSLDDLTSEADPATFDRTFRAGDANLTIEGAFDPVAGARQVLPRVAYVINYNMVYNEDRGRWEPKKNVRVIDDFEDGDLSEYTVNDVTSAQVQSSTVVEGDRALEVVNKGGSDSSVISLEGDGLPIYPERGDGFDCRVRAGDPDNEPRVLFSWTTATGAQSNGSGYELQLEASDNDIFLSRFDSGTETVLDTASATVPDNEWLRVEIVWSSDGSIQATVKRADRTEIATLEAVDSTYDAGGIGWVASDKQSNATSSFFDIAEVIR